MLTELVPIVAIVGVVAVVAIVFGRSVRAEASVQRFQLETKADEAQKGEASPPVEANARIIPADAEEKLKPPRKNGSRKKRNGSGGKK